METLAIDDIHNLSKCIQQIYTLHQLDTFGINALSIVTQLVPSDLPVFHCTHIRTRKISSTFLPDFPGFTPEMERVVDRYSSEHPITQHMPQTLTGVYKVSDFVSEQELHARKGIYQQFLRLLNTEDQMFFFLLGANPFSWFKLLQTEATLTGFALHRPQRNFTERDRLVLSLIRPHLFQAYANTRHYQQLQQSLAQFQQSIDCLGLIILDGQGRIQSITSQSIVWLETYFSKPTCAQRLPDFLWSWIEHRVSCFANNLDLSQNFPPFQVQQSGRQLVIRLVIEQLGERYLLLIEEQTPSLLNSLKILGLSQRETEVLAWAMQGKDNKSIATELQISTSTVRKHLEHIFTKLGVQSRMEASAMALTALGFDHSLPIPILI